MLMGTWQLAVSDSRNVSRIIIISTFMNPLLSFALNASAYLSEVFFSDVIYF